MLARAVLMLVLLHVAVSGANLNVLILHPVYSGSHVMVMRHLATQLTSAGHQVTQISYLNSLMTSSGERQRATHGVNVVERRMNHTRVSSTFIDPHTGAVLVPTSVLWNSGVSAFSYPIRQLGALLHAFCDDLLGDGQLLSSLRRHKFNLAIVDFLGNDCSLALARALQLPIVGFIGFPGLEPYYTGLTVNPSVYTTLMSHRAPAMSFSDRLLNTANLFVQKCIQRYVEGLSDISISKYFSYLPRSAELKKGVDLFLLNTNDFVSQPLSLPPNVKTMGCIQCRDARPLPQDMEEFVQSSDTHGVVVFSQGVTGHDTSLMSDDYIMTFFTAFARLKQKVVMRLSVQRVAHLHIPDNVRVFDWIPQLDLLGHPKTKAFISHCGINGVMESIFMKVPVLGVPVFYDQAENAQFLQYRGLGVALDRRHFDSQQVYRGLMMLIYNETLRARVSAVSSMWRSQWRTDLEHTLHWINMTATHSPLTHLQMIDSHLSWYQYWLLDVLAAIVAACALLVYLAHLVVRFAVERALLVDHAKRD